MTTEIVISGLSLLVSVVSIFIAVRTQKAFQAQGEDLESKRFFLNLWEKLVEVNAINPNNPVGVDVKNAVNILELVALLWEADVVNKDMIVVSFGDVYKERYAEIIRISTPVAGDNRNGQQIINAHPAIERVLPKIQERLSSRATIGNR